MNDSSYKDYRGDWLKDLQAKCRIKLNELEEYEDLSLEAEDILWAMQYEWEKCNKVYAVPPAYWRYGDNRLSSRQLFGAPGVVDNIIAQGIKKRELDPETVPLIPIVEYVLVPTGRVEYFDATKTRKQRNNERYWHSKAYEEFRKKRAEAQRIARQKSKGGRPRKGEEKHD